MRAGLEPIHRELDLLGNEARDAADGDGALDHVHDTLLGHAGEREVDLGLGLDTADHALELDVDEVVPHRIPLELANHGGLDATVDVQVEETDVVATGGVERIRVEVEVDVVDVLALKAGGDTTACTQLARGTATEGLSEGTLEVGVYCHSGSPGWFVATAVGGAHR